MENKDSELIRELIQELKNINDSLMCLNSIMTVKFMGIRVPIRDLDKALRVMREWIKRSKKLPKEGGKP